MYEPHEVIRNSNRFFGSKFRHARMKNKSAQQSEHLRMLYHTAKVTISLFPNHQQFRPGNNEDRLIDQFSLIQTVGQTWFNRSELVYQSDSYLTLPDSYHSKNRRFLLESPSCQSPLGSCFFIRSWESISRDPNWSNVLTQNFWAPKSEHVRTFRIRNL